MVATGSLSLLPAGFVGSSPLGRHSEPSSYWLGLRPLSEAARNSISPPVSLRVRPQGQRCSCCRFPPPRATHAAQAVTRSRQLRWNYSNAQLGGYDYAAMATKCTLTRPRRHRPVL